METYNREIVLMYVINQLQRGIFVISKLLAKIKKLPLNMASKVVL